MINQLIHKLKPQVCFWGKYDRKLIIFALDCTKSQYFV